MGVNVLGVLGIVIFYIVILVIGLWAARIRSNTRNSDGSSEGGESSEVILAGRSIGMLVGAFTMTGIKFRFLGIYLPG